MPLGGEGGLALGGREGLALGGEEGLALGGEEGLALGGERGLALGGEGGIPLGGGGSLVFRGVEGMALGDYSDAKRDSFYNICCVPGDDSPCVPGDDSPCAPWDDPPLASRGMRFFLVLGDESRPLGDDVILVKHLLHTCTFTAFPVGHALARGERVLARARGRVRKQQTPPEALPVHLVDAQVHHAGNGVQRRHLPRRNPRRSFQGHADHPPAIQPDNCFPPVYPKQNPSSHHWRTIDAGPPHQENCPKHFLGGRPEAFRKCLVHHPSHVTAQLL